jgi:glucose-6-phosphate isomerase, archaeal
MSHTLLDPMNVVIDSRSGNIGPMTGRYTKTLSETRLIYADQSAVNNFLKQDGDILTYEVQEYKVEGSDLFYGTTIIQPGLVGNEYFMTRGHFHKRNDRGEIYYTQSGSGILLLRSRSGEKRVLEMNPGTCSFIPPSWAHRSINTSNDKLVFVWCCNQDSGNDYSDILSLGMGNRILQKDDKPTIVS